MKTSQSLLLSFLLTILSCNNKKNSDVLSLGPVTDEGGFINDQTERQILSSINLADSLYGVEMAVVAIKSLGKEPLERMSLRIAEEMRLGNSSTNAGLLILYAHDEKRIRIEVGVVSILSYNRSIGCKNHKGKVYSTLYEQRT